MPAFPHQESSCLLLVYFVYRFCSQKSDCNSPDKRGQRPSQFSMQGVTGGHGRSFQPLDHADHVEFSSSSKRVGESDRVGWHMSSLHVTPVGPFTSRAYRYTSERYRGQKYKIWPDNTYAWALGGLGPRRRWPVPGSQSPWSHTPCVG